MGKKTQKLYLMLNKDFVGHMHGHISDDVITDFDDRDLIENDLKHSELN